MSRTLEVEQKAFLEVLSYLGKTAAGSDGERFVSRHDELEHRWHWDDENQEAPAAPVAASREAQCVATREVRTSIPQGP